MFFANNYRDTQFDWENQDFSMKKIFISVSGGRSSMYMAKIMKETFGEFCELVFLFANTGMEANETLDFVNECDKRWDLGIVWVEAVVNPIYNKGIRAKVVSFETATRFQNWRDGSPFEDVIAKYGIPNVSRPHCTRDLKLAPMYSYINDRWGKRNYTVAVGLRFDEIGRMSKHAIREGIIYPLLNLKITKADVNAFWSTQGFDLSLPKNSDSYGNCLMCWQKTFGKLGLVNTTHPEAFNFTRTMEERYKNAGSGTEKKVFFREYKNTDEMLLEGKRYDFDSIAKQGTKLPDESSGCSEGCEAFASHQLAAFY